jgi:hypothetical protein
MANPEQPSIESIPSPKARPMNLVIGYVVGALFYIICFVIAFKMNSDWWLNLLPCLFGGVVGWCMGMLLSPLTHYESIQFSAYGKAVSAFVTGFVIAKLETLFPGALTAQVVTTPAFVGRLLLFAITFCIGLQFTFVARRYA